MYRKIVMRKRTLVNMFLCLMGFTSAGRAATVGNLAETQGGLGKFSVGLEYERVFDRELKFKKGSIDTMLAGDTESAPIPSSGDSIKDVRAGYGRPFLKLTAGITPAVDIYGKLGTIDLEWESRYISPTLPEEKNEFSGKVGLAWEGLTWGVGTKAMIFEFKKGMRLMADVQYLNCDKVDGDYEVNGVELSQFIKNELIGRVASSVTAFYDSETRIREWQGALYLNQTFGLYSPYIGAKYSDFQLENRTKISGQLNGIVPYSIKFKEKSEAAQNFGIFIGTDVYVIRLNKISYPIWLNQIMFKTMSINIEGRFIDEKAATIGMTLGY